MAGPPPPLPLELKQKCARINEIIDELRALYVPEEVLIPLFKIANPTR